MVHESSDGLQREGLQAAAAGQHIWVFVGPGLAVCREEAGGERGVGPEWGLGVPGERGNPKVTRRLGLSYGNTVGVRGEGGGSAWREGPDPKVKGEGGGARNRERSP